MRLIVLMTKGPGTALSATSSKTVVKAKLSPVPFALSQASLISGRLLPSASEAAAILLLWRFLPRLWEHRASPTQVGP
jgi:hypothetical protein